ncbi:MAG: hypothetical protein AB1Z98_21195 [Nannocystaceae bacterium]
MSEYQRFALLGRTDNASFRLADAGVVVVVPDDGCTDDEHTARQSVTMQQEHWRTIGHRGAAIVLMDRVAHQTKDARRVYQTEVDPELIAGFGLVTRSVFGRAIASVFMGLARPVVPTRMFGDLDEALRWARRLHEDAP